MSRFTQFAWGVVNLGALAWFYVRWAWAKARGKEFDTGMENT